MLHPAETSTTQEGVYPVLLFHEDLQSVEATIIQGVTELNQRIGRRAAAAEFERRSSVLRLDFEPLGELEFHADSDFVLGRSSLGRDYVSSTIVHRRFATDDLPTSTVSDDLVAALDTYGELLSSGRLGQLAATDAARIGRRALMVYVGQSASANFASGGKEGWWGWREAPSGLEELRPGDLIAFGRGFDGSPRVDSAVWQSKGLREVVVGSVIAPPERTDRLVMPDELAGEASYPWKIRFKHLGAESQVDLAPGRRLSAQASEGRGAAH